MFQRSQLRRTHGTLVVKTYSLSRLWNYDVDFQVKYAKESDFHAIIQLTIFSP